MNQCTTATDDENSSIKVKKTGIVGEVAEGSSSLLVHQYLTPLVSPKSIPASMLQTICLQWKCRSADIESSKAGL